MFHLPASLLGIFASHFTACYSHQSLSFSWSTSSLLAMAVFVLAFAADDPLPCAAEPPREGNRPYGQHGLRSEGGPTAVNQQYAMPKCVWL
eukprot:scaffold301861_cov45-Prasinocladus_malaysianus.AAC.1